MKMILLGAPTGSVGNGPYSVWIKNDTSKTEQALYSPEAFGFETADEAFAHADKIKAQQQAKMAALVTLASDAIPPELVDELKNVAPADFAVFRMEEVKRVDVSQLPKL